MSKNKGFSSTSANRYSLALYELAEEANVLSQIEINVLSIINLIEKSNDFKNLIKDPTVSQNDLSNAIKNEIAECDYFIMNAAVADFKILGETSKKIPKSEIENFFNNNIEFIPDILKGIC